ncbi:MAG: hypothetical protein PHN56_04025 [Candidatus Nanoarchaeia archaeon]|nr:hypothetical protein [Candidatus Nanoarchaeia archaeon]
MKTNASKQTVLNAIENVNKEHGYELQLNRNDQSGKWFNFTLKTRSKIPGARVSYSGRNLASASWHAHGYVFGEIFKLEPDCVIWSNGKKLKSGFTWDDTNIGSLMQPCYYSETSIL